MTTYYDLTNPLGNETTTTVGQEHLEMFTIRDIVSTGILIKGVKTNLHAGTHIDAPSHFPGSPTTLDEIPVSVLCGTGVVLDMRHKKALQAITADDLEQADPKIEPGDRVVINTGWHRYYFSDPETYIFQPPGCDKSAIDWFVAKGVSWVGSDAPSPDHTLNLSERKASFRPDIYTAEFMATIDRDQFPPQYGHRTLLKNNIPMVEYLGGEIDEVTGQRVTLFALPPKYLRAEAAQVRVVAAVD